MFVSAKFDVVIMVAVRRSVCLVSGPVLAPGSHGTNRCARSTSTPTPKVHGDAGGSRGDDADRRPGQTTIDSTDMVQAHSRPTTVYLYEGSSGR